MVRRHILSLLFLFLFLQLAYAPDVNSQIDHTGSISRDTAIISPEGYRDLCSHYVDSEMAGYQPVRHIPPQSQSFSGKTLENYEYDFEFIGSAAWGFCIDVQVRENIAYCTYGAGLMIIDISDASDPKLISKYYTQDTPEQLSVYGNYAYVATNGKAMDIIDISDIYHPFEAGYYGDYGAWNIALDTSRTPLRAAILGNEGAQFVEIWHPQNIILKADPFIMAATDMIFDNGVGYLIDANGLNLQLWDVSDYNNLHTFSIQPLPGSPNGLVKKGNIVYVAQEEGYIGNMSTPPQITAVDVSDVYNPSIITSFDSLAYYYYPYNIDMIGDTLFVSMGLMPQIQFFDVSNPNEINRIGLADAYNDAFGIDVYDNKLYVGCSYSGLNIFDISDFDNVVPLGRYTGESGGSCKTGCVYNIKLDDNLAYVFNCGALTPIDISDPAHPFSLSCDDNVHGRQFDLQGDYAFSVNSTGTGGSRGIDIADPYNILTLSYLHYPATSWDIDVEGDYAYIATDSAGLQVTDISDPSNLFIASYYNEIYSGDQIAGTVTTRDNIAFIGDSHGMRAIDITDPLNPVKIGDYETWTQQGVRRIVLRDSLAFLALQPNDSLMMAVVNISDPTNMTTVGICVPPNDMYDEHFKFLWDDAQDIALSGNYAFVANGGCYGHGLLMLDISDLSNIHIVGKYDTPADAVIGVKSRGRYVYLTDYYAMIILHVDYPAPCGDFNGNDAIDIFDITSIIDYLYLDGPPSEYPEATDVNSDGLLNLFDIVYLIQYLYLSGPAPNCM
jgi:hypothetical protein